MVNRKYQAQDILEPSVQEILVVTMDLGPFK